MGKKWIPRIGSKVRLPGSKSIYVVAQLYPFVGVWVQRRTAIMAVASISDHWPLRISPAEREQAGGKDGK